MTVCGMAPERRKFPVSASESPKLKIESYYLRGGLIETVPRQEIIIRIKMIFMLVCMRN